MKIRPVGTALIHGDRRTWRRKWALLTIMRKRRKIY